MDKFKLILQSVSPLLKRQGYVKNNITFYLFKENNWGIINFQKSRDSTKTELMFTINIGIVSSLLRRFVDQNPSTDKPPTGYYHWSTRIGALMPDKKDFWWKLNDSDDVDNLIIDVATVVKELAIPAVDHQITDEGLIKTFMSKSPGTSLINKYIYLTTLLKLKGDERLGEYIDEMLETSSGKPTWAAANDHIRNLNSI